MIVRQPNKCAIFVKMLGLIIIFASIVVLVGLFYHIPALVSVLPHTKPMVADTAICFILSGSLLIISVNSSRMPRGVISSFAGLILLISLINIIEIIFNLNFVFTQFLIKKTTQQSIENVNSMTFLTAMNFIVIAVLFLFKQKISVWVSQLIALLIFFLSLVSFYNYIFLTDIHYVVAFHTTMAVLSTALFILFCIGFLLIKYDEGMVEIAFRKTTGGYYARRTIPLILFIPMIIVIVENKMERLGLIDSNFGDVITVAGSFILLSSIVLIVARKIDNDEEKLKTAKLQHQQDELIFNRFLENIDIVFYRASPDLSKIYYVNPAYEKIWGKSIQSLYEKPLEWFEAILPEDQPAVHQAFFENMQRGKTGGTHIEFRINKPDGSIHTIFSHGFELKDHLNNPFCVMGFAVDMTEVLRDKKYLQNRDDILQLIEHGKSIRDVGEKILKLICQMINWDLGEIWLIDEEKNVIRFVNSWHIENLDTSRTKTFHSGEELAGKVWFEKNHVWISDYSKLQEAVDLSDENITNLKSALGIPIIFQDHIFGVMLFYSYQIHTYDETMLNQMNNIGKLMGEFMYRTHTSEQIQSLSKRDILTGLLSRSAVEEDLDKLIHEKQHELITVIIVDIDQFKMVNQALGHDQGDFIIKSAAKRLEDLINRDNACVSRLGADKFILYYFNIKNKEEIRDYISQIERSFKEPFAIDHREIFLTISLGITVYPDDGMDSKTLITNADQALANAKKNGGNKSLYFTKELTGVALEELRMHIEMHQAIKNNQFSLSYQPQVDLKTGKICGAEALVRWQHPSKGIVSPGEFIGYAEQAGLIVSLNEQIMRMVFQQINSDWKGPTISVNISAKQFKDKYHLVEYLESLMNEYGVNPKYIELEVTESIIMEDTQHNISLLSAINHLGFKIAIDDFGTGFSSFNYLYRLPAHKIKIDKSFITGLPGNKANAEIVKSMIALLHALDRVVVAEGAETEGEINYLKQEKCDIVQGYYYYKPLLAENFIGLCRKSNS